MSLVKFDGKAVDRLLDVVSKGIGTVYKPRAIRNEADAKAYANVVLAKAEAQKILIEGDAKLELIERAKERLMLKEMNRQINIEEIVEKAIPLLSETISDDIVDNDWRTRFFNKAQDVSQNELQKVWASILAKEVSNPGNVSLRTLDVVSNISKNEAEKFIVACSITSSYTSMLKINGSASFDKYGLDYTDLMLLRDASLLHAPDNLTLSIAAIDHFGTANLTIGNKQYRIRPKNNISTSKNTFEAIALTQSGVELCKLLDTPINTSYEIDFLSFIKSSYIIDDAKNLE